MFHPAYDRITTRYKLHGASPSLALSNRDMGQQSRPSARAATIRGPLKRRAALGRDLDQLWIFGEQFFAHPGIVGEKLRRLFIEEQVVGDDDGAGAVMIFSMSPGARIGRSRSFEPRDRRKTKHA
jgi:hypothetical protein